MTYTFSFLSTKHLHETIAEPAAVLKSDVPFLETLAGEGYLVTMCIRWKININNEWGIFRLLK